MQTGILVTNGGPHSPEDWAYASASMLLNALVVDPASTRRVQLEMAKDVARPQIAGIMLDHHVKAQALEREKLAKSHDRLIAPLDAGEHTDIEAAAKKIFLVMKPLADQAQLFSGGVSSNEQAMIDAHLLNLIRQRVMMDLHTNMHIERSWHADHNPGIPQAAAFKAAHHGA